MERFGQLTVLSADGAYRLCRCDCGREKRIRIDHLKSGATVSCGCVGRRNSAAAKTTHGMSHTRTFKIWLGMLDRCRNDRSGNYGSRGIAVCDRWQTFENFFSDMGEAPSPNHSLDRIDVNGGYQPDNCRWATRTQQARNTRVNTVLEYQGEIMTLAEWSERVGITASTLCARLYHLNWPLGKALTEPVKSYTTSAEVERQVVEVWRGGAVSMREVGRVCGISHKAVKRILQRRGVL